MGKQGFGIVDQLQIAICENPEQAAAAGFTYPADAVKMVEVIRVVVIKQGTVNGNSTVDFLMEDEDGQHYLVMMTGNLIKGIPC